MVSMKNYTRDDRFLWSGGANVDRAVYDSAVARLEELVQTLEVISSIANDPRITRIAEQAINKSKHE